MKTWLWDFDEGKINVYHGSTFQTLRETVKIYSKLGQWNVVKTLFNVFYDSLKKFLKLKFFLNRNTYFSIKNFVFIEQNHRKKHFEIYLVIMLNHNIIIVIIIIIILYSYKKK